MSSSLVGATCGPAHPSRAGTRITSGKWPLPSGRGPETYGSGVPLTGVLGIRREPRADDMRAGAQADKLRDGHDTVCVTA